MVLLISLFSPTVFFGVLATNSVVGFAPAHLKTLLITLPRAEFSSQLTRLYQTDNEDDEPELIEKLIPTEKNLNELGLGLQFTPQEIEELSMKIQGDVDAVFDAELANIDRLRKNLERDAEASKERMENASRLEAQYVQQNFRERIGKVKNEFLDSTADFRETTKRIAAADQMAATSGRGVDWGSWGTIGGMDVVVGDSSDMPRLLGSVDSVRGSADDDGQKVAISSENRVMVVSDEQKDKGSKRVMDGLRQLLDKAFKTDITIDTYSPASNIPMGGKNAQTALIFASSLNDRSSLENLLGRVLKRTAPVAGGAAGVPPSHVVIVSSLGTERTNKMPYSMQNMFSGKLDKLREIEQSIVTISRGRSEGGKQPLDYTIVKLGDVTNNDGDGSDQTIEIRPGDDLDGEIGPIAAANVLLQAMAYQPYARNSTMCATGMLPPGVQVDTDVWNDKFVCLSGPELLRIEAGPGKIDGEEILDSKFESLAAYVKEWSSAYEGDRKGTGLTTPVLIRNSRKGPSKFDGVIAREGIRILFQATNTGDRYKSASEDRAAEEERSGGATASKPSSPRKIVGKGRKEGGVEILVEKTNGGELRVRARRCNMDPKTIVKEMSEDLILRNLKKAVIAWVEARSVTGF